MIDGFLLALSPGLLIMTLSGVCLGIIWGALPGLSTTMAMGLLIGLSAGMSQEVAISFMLGVYTGSVFGGAISAVLINIPGTPDAVPTMIEGHQLAQKGEGGQALGMAIAASFVGGSIGIILLITLIPMILTFALNFRSWEMFWLAVIGIMVSGSMAAGSVPLKGWIAGWLGMLIAFVGLDAIHAVPRFTFGTFALYDGVSYVAVLIGCLGSPKYFAHCRPKTAQQSRPKLAVFSRLFGFWRNTHRPRSGPVFWARSLARFRGQGPMWPRFWPMILAAAGPNQRNAPNGAKAATRRWFARKPPITPISVAQCCQRWHWAFPETPQRPHFWLR
ncbi:MAG: tripartite tricarboxylate transporter permease [Rhodobacteraceae bacterium]|nr:tripartite tricarboxylate transporter permease [Paracoccaceae bacterium]